MKYFTIFILMLVFPTLHSQENQASGEIVPFKQIEQPPTFPGCEDESRDCTLQKITDLFNAEFNRNIFPDSPAKINLAIKAIIDESGEIKWHRVSTSSPIAEKETARILDSIPRLSPGIQDQEKVNTIISLNFQFEVSRSHGLYDIESDVDSAAYIKECEAAETEDERKKCTSLSIQKQVNTAFNKGISRKTKTNLAKTTVSFVVDSEGKIIEVEAEGEYKAMNKEGEKVIKDLPFNFIPATKDGEQVSVPLKLEIFMSIGS